MRYEKERHAANENEEDEHRDQNAVRFAAESPKEQNQHERDDRGDRAAHAEDSQEHALKLGIHGHFAESTLSSATRRINRRDSSFARS